MRETITLSGSHLANHVATHLFNNQESHLSYSSTTPSRYANSVYLVSSKTPLGRLNYYPRALIYDLAGSNGSMGKYEYYSAEDGKAMSSLGTLAPVSLDIIRTFPTVEKNQYQKALDSGTTLKEGLLNKENTKYWTDYNKLIYNPKSLHYLTDWVHNTLSFEPGFHRNSTNDDKKLFDLWYLGKNEAMASIDDQLDTFRHFLEDCDLFQGSNMFTEVDSAWGGFTTELLREIKDEFFNGHAKHSFWTWAMFNDNKSELKFKNKYSRIRTFIDISNVSSMVFPLIEPEFQPSILSESYDSQSIWHSSALKSYVVDSLWNITNPVLNWVSMSSFEEDLIQGKSRNIVGDITINTPKKAAQEDGLFGIISEEKNPWDLYNTDANTDTNTNTKPEKASINSILFSGMFKSTKRSQYYGRNYIIPQNVLVHIEELNKEQVQKQALFARNHYKLVTPTITSNETFPEIFNDSNDMYTEFSIGTQPLEFLKETKKFLQKSSRITMQLFETDYEEHAELIENVGILIEDYTAEWEDDEDDDWD